MRQLRSECAQSSRLHYLRTLEDAEALRAGLQPGRRLLVIGGGWIGLEVAATARKLGLEVVVLKALARLCERSVPPAISSFLLDLHRANGVDVRLGVGLERLRDDGDGVLAELGDGSTLRADLALAGIGLIPNTELAAEAGLEVDNGIVVDAQGRTSDTDAFTSVVRGDFVRHAATLVYLDDERRPCAVIAVNAGRDISIARKWMRQGKVLDPAALADTGVPLQRL